MNCEKCKELLVAYVEELLEEPGKQSVAEHLKDCASCQSQLKELTALHGRLVKNGKALARGDLENDVMNRIVREQNVRLKAATRAVGWGSAPPFSTGGPRPTLQIRRIIMKSPMTRIAAAAALIVVAALGINSIMAPSVTWAQVIEPILNARTMVFDLILGTDDTGMVQHEIVVGSRMRRTMSNMPNMTMIIDTDNAQLLALDTEAKTAVYADMAGDLGDRHRSYIKFVRQIIGQLQDGQVEQLGERVIDGQKAIGFVGRGQNEEVRIWADPETTLPIRIEAQVGQELSFIMKNFEFDAAVDESLMSMDVPDGYTLQKTNLDLGNASEEDFVKSLRIWAEIIGDGTFPQAIGTQSAMTQMPVLIQKVGAMQVSEEEGTEIAMSFAKGMLFHQILENQGQWKYAGAGVKLGDAAKAIFWYQPQGSATYRVIYGDLSVKDVAPENLPQ
ncbi:MAG TPA: zf-HC2 domain-containing protein [Sedimentisphaerales bacterium]|nr:zf-HC2 domain-containing protein [Sedimentisphaerales bacterium]